MSYLGNDFYIYYSFNKNFDSMIDEMEIQSGVVIRTKEEYIPKLKLDICFAILNKKRKLN